MSNPVTNVAVVAKPWWEMRTIWMALVTIVALLANTFFGLKIDATLQDLILDHLLELVALVSSSLTIFFRIKATAGTAIPNPPN